jgi:serine phosphatase RsbU (regulator of sigma subunit)
MHERLRPTRGAALAVAAIDYAERTVRFAGIGNVAAWIVHHDGRQGMISQPGIVGHNVRTPVREATYALPRGSIVVLHSDGLTDRWDLKDYPGLLNRAPVVLAAVLLRDAGIRHDDASILVAAEQRGL